MSPSVLVIEDNEHSLLFLDDLLRAYGYQPQLARSGSDGLRIALADRPEVVLLDLWISGMDGYAVAREIKCTSELESTHVIAVTASAMVGDRERIESAGFDGYIQKPIDPETFIETLQQILLPAADHPLVEVEQ